MDTSESERSPGFQSPGRHQTRPPQVIQSLFVDEFLGVSVVALLVSLVALLIALLQVLQQYFATAVGYRNCAESIIGPWHTTRHRRLVPSEFRFETVYDAPLIRLLSISECVKEMIESPHRERIHLLYPLCEKPESEGERLILETVHPSKALPKSWRSYLPQWTGLRRTSKEDTTGEGGAHPPKKEFEDPASALVSWIAFLRAVHHTYSLYGDMSEGTDLRAERIKRYIWRDHLDPRRPDQWHDASNRTAAESSKRVVVRQSLRRPNDWYDVSGRMAAEPCQPVVVRQTVHWDVRGSDTSRPVAQTRLGDIILFALRMGMQWRKLEVENGTMLAVGNGYGLTSANRSGLNMSFTSAGDHKELPNIIPSQHADKLLCGILPGDPDLVRQDFSMVRRGGRRESEEHILRKIMEFHDSEKDVLRQRFAPAARHDLMKLLCPFLPQQFSNSAVVRFAGWPWHRGPSFLHYFESRISLVQRLEEEVNSDDTQYTDEELRSLQYAKSRLDLLKNEHAQDFYCVEFTPYQGIPESRSDEKRSYSVRFLQECELTFRKCTECLKDHGWSLPTTNRPEGGSTRYTLLVAAHIIMTNRAIETSEKRVQEVKKQLKNDLSGRRIFPQDWAGVIGIEDNAPPQARDWLRNPRFYFRMNKMIQDMKSNDYGIREELAELGVQVTNSEAQLAWWMMMIRGVAWDMSCYRESWPQDEPLVPSTFYQDPTPVMLA